MAKNHNFNRNCRPLRFSYTSHMRLLIQFALSRCRKTTVPASGDFGRRGLQRCKFVGDQTAISCSRRSNRNLGCAATHEDFR